MNLIGLKFTVATTSSTPSSPEFSDIVSEGRNEASSPAGPTVLVKTVGLSVDFFSAAGAGYSPVLKYLRFNYTTGELTSQPIQPIPSFLEDVLETGEGRFEPRSRSGCLFPSVRRSPDPAKELQFFDLREGYNDGKGFSFFSLDALDVLVRHSNYLTLSGAFVGYGAVKDSIGRYDEKAYFTLKFVGDMVNHYDWKGIFQGDNNPYSLPREIQAGFNERFLDNPSFALQNPKISEVDLPYILAGHPCPPFWDPGRAIVGEIMLQAAKDGWLQYNGDEAEWYIRIPGLEAIRQDQYRELVRLAVFEYCVTNYS